MAKIMNYVYAFGVFVLMNAALYSSKYTGRAQIQLSAALPYQGRGVGGGPRFNLGGGGGDTMTSYGKGYSLGMGSGGSIGTTGRTDY